MRGNYFDSQNSTPKESTPTETAKGNGPQVMPATETPATYEDVKSIVAHVAHSLLKAELGVWNANVLQILKPLNNVSPADYQRAIAEALA